MMQNKVCTTWYFSEKNFIRDISIYLVSSTLWGGVGLTVINMLRQRQKPCQCVEAHHCKLQTIVFQWLIVVNQSISSCPLLSSACSIIALRLAKLAKQANSATLIGTGTTWETRISVSMLMLDPSYCYITITPLVLAGVGYFLDRNVLNSERFLFLKL